MVCTPVLILTAGLAQAQTANVTTQSFNDTRQGGLIDRTAIPERRAVSPEMRGDIYMARKMFREAVDMYRQMPPDSAISWNKTGIAFHQMLDLESARRSYERSLKLNPKYPEAINNLGTVHYARKNYRKAISYYKKALELDPEVFEHRNAAGVLLQERSVEERAKFHCYLAKTYAKAGIHDRALLYLRKALEEGFKEREKLTEDPEFAGMQALPEFQEILKYQPKVL